MLFFFIREFEINLFYILNFIFGCKKKFFKRYKNKILLIIMYFILFVCFFVVFMDLRWCC